MKKLILLALMLVVNIFICACVAQETYNAQEAHCKNKSLSHCLKHYDKLCEAKNYPDCYIVGNLHIEQEQYSEAKKYYEMVCNNANSIIVEFVDKYPDFYSLAIGIIDLSCNNLGELYKEGYGVTQSYKKASHYYKKGCDLGGVLSCFYLGIAFEKGRGVRQNYSKAKELYGKACDLGDQDGCDYYKELKEKGY